MESGKIKSVVLCIILGIVLSVILFGVGVLIASNTDETLRDVLFIEGILSIMFGIFSCVGGNPMGLSLQGMGQNNAQYIGTSNLEMSKVEKSKFKNGMKVTISLSFSTVSLIVAGVICIGINYMI